MESAGQLSRNMPYLRSGLSRRTKFKSADMVIYNVTVNIDENVNEEWVKWMKDDHIPAVLATGHFHGSTFSKILAEEAGGFAYSIQYLAKSMEALEKYMAEEAPRLRKEFQDQYGTKAVSFRTLLDVIHKADHNG